MLLWQRNMNFEVLIFHVQNQHSLRATWNELVVESFFPQPHGTSQKRDISVNVTFFLYGLYNKKCLFLNIYQDPEIYMFSIILETSLCKFSTQGRNDRRCFRWFN